MAVNNETGLSNEQREKYKTYIKNSIKEHDTLFKRDINMNITMETGEIAYIYISSDDSSWTFVIKGKQSGKWVTTYGFGFTSQLFERATYFMKQISGTTDYQISKSRDPNFIDLNYVPAVFFSYFPSHRLNKWWNNSLSAGLGFDLSAPVVFLGYNGMFNHNIGISAGLVFQ